MNKLFDIGIPTLGFTVTVIDYFHGVAAALIAVMTIVYLFFRIRNEIKKSKK